MARTYDDRLDMAPAPAAQAFQVMRFAFTVAPIVMGLDKFFNVLVNWEQYLAPWISHLLPISPAIFMRGVGVVEIIAGLIVGFWPMVGGWIVAAWLWAIIINLLTGGGYYDIAVRDFGLSLGAVSLARLAALAMPAHRQTARSEEARAARRDAA